MRENLHASWKLEGMGDEHWRPLASPDKDDGKDILVSEKSRFSREKPDLLKSYFG